MAAESVLKRWQRPSVDTALRMEHLPLELLWSIWHYVEPRDLYYLNTVCKRFSSMLPPFCANAFRTHYSASSPPPVTITWLQLFASTSHAEMRKREAQSAALPGHDLVLEWAISKGFERFAQARIRTAPLDWSRALTLAIEQDQLEITRNLIRGADPSTLGARMVYPEAPSPVALAVQHGRVLILHEMLALSTDADMTALLIYSARTGSTNVLEYLHRRGTSLDATKTKVINGERTVTNALIEAVLHDQEEVVEYLLRNHASPDMPVDKPGDAPLVVTVQTHNLRLTMMLLMAGARTHITDVHGTSLMQLAVTHAPCIARLLVRVNGYRAIQDNVNNQRKRRYSAPENHFAVKYAR